MKKCQVNADTFQKKFYMFCQYSCKQGIVPVNLKIIKKKSFLITSLPVVNLFLGLQISRNIDSSSNGPCIIKLFQVISLDLNICFINLKSKIAMISKSIFVDWKNLSDH